MSFQLKLAWKIVLLLFAVNIAVLSLLYTNKLVKELAAEEVTRVNQWTSAVQRLNEAEDEDVTFLMEVMQQSSSNIPIILTDEDGTILNSRNLDTARINDPEYLQQELLEMMAENPPLVIEYLEGKNQYVYYKNSILLTKLRYYPVYQIAVISLFLLVSYLAFNASRRSEQNRVWVGLAKETAHQLGTPISSLIAWVDLIRTLEGKPDPDMLKEMEKDVQRLKLVSERFSKIGSVPVLEDCDVKQLIDKSVEYMSLRASSKVKFSVIAEELHNCFALINIQLFDWVLENLTKNAIDAMEGQGSITFRLSETRKLIYIDITDSGKGIPSSKFKDVFKPGFTTKKRGWGLGLSLAKRIIEEYHRGKIFVKESIPGKGTTFRIVLKKN